MDYVICLEVSKWDSLEYHQIWHRIMDQLHDRTREYVCIEAQSPCDSFIELLPLFTAYLYPQDDDLTSLLAHGVTSIYVRCISRYQEVTQKV